MEEILFGFYKNFHLFSPQTTQQTTGRHLRLPALAATLIPLDLEMNPCQSLAVETFQRGSVLFGAA